jgi:hypothetical protein
MRHLFGAMHRSVLTVSDKRSSLRRHGGSGWMGAYVRAGDFVGSRTSIVSLLNLDRLPLGDETTIPHYQGSIWAN